ncbi:hypothetical protein HGRIS_006994 [Hohenbuehelia grisea]|uniref:Uncharacterized protein n=1 Tax=Hohenbuehelia grisea TaxID=104357 RepID=A0ABR3JBV7_9AGAR
MQSGNWGAAQENQTPTSADLRATPFPLSASSRPSTSRQGSTISPSAYLPSATHQTDPSMSSFQPPSAFAATPLHSRSYTSLTGVMTESSSNMTPSTSAFGTTPVSYGRPEKVQRMQPHPQPTGGDTELMEHAPPSYDQAVDSR